MGVVDYITMDYALFILVSAGMIAAVVIGAYIGRRW